VAKSADTAQSGTLLAAEDMAVQPAAPAADTSLALVVERLASNPGVDVEKLERVIALQERILRFNAEAAFNGAFSEMQGDLPEIDEKGQILVKGTLRSTYAKLEDIHEAVKPVLKKHGFAIRHRTEWPSDRPGIIRIVGILTHRQGYSAESVFEAPMDRSEYRTDIQSMGSTVSYGRRYTTLDVLNIVTRAQDNDGATAGRPQPPDGYDTWWKALESAAKDGFKVLDECWAQTKNAEYKNFTIRHNGEAWKELRAKATAVKK